MPTRSTRSVFHTTAFFQPVTTMHQTLLLLSCTLLAVSASNVIDLTDANFDSKITEHDTILVEFFAPWCGHCKRLAPEYEKAADRLKANESPAALAKVDCTAETSTCSKFGVSGYPTLKIFKNGEMSKEYSGPREADGIVKTMERESGPASKELTTLKEFEAFISKPGACAVAFLKDKDGDLGKAFQKVADTNDNLRFAHTTAKEILDKQKYNDEVVLFRPKIMENKFEDTAVKYTGAKKQQDIKQFLDNEYLGLCAERTGANAIKFKKPTFVAFYDVDYIKNPKGTNYWRNRVMKVAKKLRDEGLTAYFAVSSRFEMSPELEECGLAGRLGEKPLVCAYDERSRKFSMEDEFSMETFEKFVRDVLDETIEPYLKSEPVPENNDGPVKVVVGRNFDEIVNDPEKDVLVEFYAPWCGHCKTLAPKFDELGETLKDESSIVIAKMDATANDVPTPYEVRGFPTLFFAPKGSKSNPKKYEGGREVEDFIKYLAKEATDELQGFNRKGKKKGDKKKKSEL